MCLKEETAECSSVRRVREIRHTRGSKIQILDDYAPQYANLKPWQYCGSVYGVQAPSMRAAKKAGEWQHMQIVADGPRITVVLNGQRLWTQILIAHMDKETVHPGLKRRAGFIGLQCHGAESGVSKYHPHTNSGREHTMTGIDRRRFLQHDGCRKRGSPHRANRKLKANPRKGRVSHSEDLQIALIGTGAQGSGA